MATKVSNGNSEPSEDGDVRAFPEPEKSPRKLERRRRREQRRQREQRFLSDLRARTPRIWIVPTLIAMNFVVWLMTYVSASSGRVSRSRASDWAAVSGESLVDGEWWRLLSAAFAHEHGTLEHVVGNMMALAFVGRLVERMFGHVGFLALYAFSAVGASMLGVLVAPENQHHGASGAIFGLVGAYAYIALRHRRAVPASVPLKHALVMFVLLPFALVPIAVLVQRFVGDAAWEYEGRVGHAGHLGGFVAGVVAGFLLDRGVGADVAGSGWRRARRFAAGAVAVCFALALLRARVEANPSVKARLHARRAAELARSEDWQGAEREWSAAIAAEPNQPYWYLRRNGARLELADSDGAVADIARATELAPDDARLYVQQGWTWQVAGRPDRADASYARAVELNPSDTDTRHRRAWLLWTRGDASGACAEFDKVIEAGSSCDAHRGRARARADLGDLTGALEDADRAVELSPTLATAHRERGVVLEMADRPEDAEAAYTRTLELDPTDSWARKQRAWLRSDRGAHGEALLDYDQYIDAMPTDAHAYLGRCRVRYHLADFLGALADADRAIELTPSYAKAHQYRGWALEASRRIDEAKAAYERAFELDPSDTWPSRRLSALK